MPSGLCVDLSLGSWAPLPAVWERWPVSLLNPPTPCPAHNSHGRGPCTKPESLSWPASATGPPLDMEVQTHGQMLGEPWVPDHSCPARVPA